jgi:uncharacterized repeat protein (TIGR03803 family)
MGGATWVSLQHLRLLVASAIVAVGAPTTVARAQPVFTVLDAFARGVDGAEPSAALIQATDGNFYGTTRVGGDPACYCGTVFRMTPTGTVTVLHTFTGYFNGTDGAEPSAALIQATDGNFYGTTS